MQLKPSDIRFSQDSINNYFDQRSSHSYKSVGETLDDLCERRCSINDIPTITVVNEDGHWITADNRRLWVFRELERLGKCTTIPVQKGYYIPDAKRTSYNSGKSISVRRNAGGRWHTKPTVHTPTPYTPVPSTPTPSTPAPSTNIYKIGETLPNKYLFSSIGNHDLSRIQPVESRPKIESYLNLRNGMHAKDPVLPFQTNQAARPAIRQTNQITSTPFGYESYTKPSTMIYSQNRTDGCRSMSTDAVTAKPALSQLRSGDTTMFPVTSTGQNRTDDCRSISTDAVTAKPSVSQWSSGGTTMFPVTSTGQSRTDGCRSMSTDVVVTAKPSLSQWRSGDPTMFPVTSTGIKRESAMNNEHSPSHYGYKEGVVRSAVTTNDTRAERPDNIRSISSPSHEVNLENVIPEIQGEGRRSHNATIVDMLCRDEQNRKRMWCTIL